jgi:hypothetical protein
MMLVCSSQLNNCLPRKKGNCDEKQEREGCPLFANGLLRLPPSPDSF